MLRKTADVTFGSAENRLTAFVCGEIDHHAARDVRYIIDLEMAKAHPKSLVLDLSGVSFMDSSGLGLILGRYNKAVELGIEFAVKKPSASAARILKAAGAGRIIKIEEN